MLTLVCVVILVVLVPLIPAFVLFKVLPPGRTIIKGPFKGLELHMTGSAAAYVIISAGVALISWWFLKTDVALWVVQGSIKMKDESEVLLCIQPPVQDRRPGGFFTIRDVPLSKTQKALTPSLIVYRSGFLVENVPLTEKRTFGAKKDYGVVVRELENIIELREPIVLEPATQTADRSPH